MTDEEFNKKMEGVVSKTTPKPKRRKKKGQKQNSFQLWEQLFEDNLKKMGYIK